MPAPASLLFALLLVMVSAGPAASAETMTFSKTKLTVATAAGNTYAFTVEVADTPRQREQGLMFRDSIPENGGMLFLFPEPHIATFWMHNTFISLDILFVARDGRIVNIHDRAVPGSEAILAAAGPVTAVLEIRGGLAARLGIRPGDRLVHPAFSVAGTGP